MGTNLRSDFPQIASSNLIYLDNAATTAKPQCVIDALSDYYINNNANTHSGIYDLAFNTAELFNTARKIVANVINASSDEIIFTRGATDSFNIVAHGCVWDEVFICITEHHSNMLPWRNVAKKVHYVYCEQDGSYDLDKIKEIIKNHSGRSLLALSAHSNVFGRNIRYREMCNIAKQNDIYVMLDATQMLAHERIDVVDSNVDFMAFSAHKLYGPMGVGALYVKKDHFNFLKPSNVGGGSVANVTETDFTLLPRSESFEPGTMNIGGAIGFGVAMDYLTKNSTEIVALEKDIAKYAYDTLSRIQHLRVVSRPDDVIISFTMDDIHPHDIAQYLNTFKICVRAGYHCAQPGLDYLGIGPVTRVSLCFYNTKPEIDTLVGVLQKIYKEMKLDV